MEREEHQALCPAVPRPGEHRVPVEIGAASEQRGDVADPQEPLPEVFRSVRAQE